MSSKGDAEQNVEQLPPTGAAVAETVAPPISSLSNNSYQRNRKGEGSRTHDQANGNSNDNSHGNYGDFISSKFTIKS